MGGRETNRVKEREDKGMKKWERYLDIKFKIEYLVDEKIEFKL